MASTDHKEFLPGDRLRKLKRRGRLIYWSRWAKSYGIEKALSEMRAAGQSAKADKLEAAARAAGAL